MTSRPTSRQPILELRGLTQLWQVRDTLLGPGVFGTPRPRLAARHSDELAFAGIMGYVPADSIEPPLGWVRFADDQTYCHLGALDSVGRQWKAARSEAASTFSH